MGPRERVGEKRHVSGRYKTGQTEDTGTRSRKSGQTPLGH